MHFLGNREVRLKASGKAMNKLLEVLLNVKQERKIAYEIQSKTVKVVDNDDKVREISALDVRVWNAKP